jgi:hypothetical protein
MVPLSEDEQNAATQLKAAVAARDAGESWEIDGDKGISARCVQGSYSGRVFFNHTAKDWTWCQYNQDSSSPNRRGTRSTPAKALEAVTVAIDANWRADRGWDVGRDV